MDESNVIMTETQINFLKALLEIKDAIDSLLLAKFKAMKELMPKIV